MCKNYDKDDIPPAIIRKLKPFIDNPEFDPAKLESVSQAAVSLCMWVRAMYTYSEVAKTVEPKRARLNEAEKKLSVVQGILQGKQREVRLGPGAPLDD
jgi:dynein heavy chain